MRKINRGLDVTLRSVQFLFGLFVMSFGIGLTVRAGIGTSQISSVPVVLAEATTLSVGAFTIILNMLMLVAQVFVLRRRFPPIQALQVFAAFAFGWFCDFSLWLLSDLAPSSYVLQFATVFAGSVLLGVGVWIQVSAKAIYLPAEGLVAAIAKVSRKDFSAIKIINDLALVALAIILSFALLGRLEGVREGTVLSALLVGPVVKLCRIGWAKIRKPVRSEAVGADTVTTDTQPIPTA